MADDYYGVAQEICKKNGGHLPSESELEQIASALYSTESRTFESIDIEYSVSVMANKETVYAALGLTDNPSEFWLWSSVPHDVNSAFIRSFSSDDTRWNYSTRDYEYPRVVCLSD